MLWRKFRYATHFSPMRQIAGDDGKCRVGVVPVDVRDSCIEPSLGVETVKLEAWLDQVRVGDVDKFHYVNRLLCNGLAMVGFGLRRAHPCNPASVCAIWHGVRRMATRTSAQLRRHSAMEASWV
jgi:hypothetical protein